jgi:hypothetical protein
VILKIVTNILVKAATSPFALLGAAFERKIRAQKLVESARRGAAASIDNVVVLPSEYPKYLRMAYRKEKFPKPRNILGIAKDLPDPEMEKLILAHIRITDDDLRLLSQARAREVRRFLVGKGAVAPERIFLTEAGRPDERKETSRGGRADFVLR